MILRLSTANEIVWPSRCFFSWNLWNPWLFFLCHGFHGLSRIQLFEGVCRMAEFS